MSQGGREHVQENLSLCRVMNKSLSCIISRWSATHPTIHSHLSYYLQISLICTSSLCKAILFKHPSSPFTKGTEERAEEYVKPCKQWQVNYSFLMLSYKQEEEEAQVQVQGCSFLNFIYPVESCTYLSYLHSHPLANKSYLFDLLFCFFFWFIRSSRTSSST